MCNCYLRKDLGGNSQFSTASTDDKRLLILSSAKSGSGTDRSLSRECSSHVTTYFRTFVRTFESTCLVSWFKHSRERPVPGPTMRFEPLVIKLVESRSASHQGWSMTKGRIRGRSTRGGILNFEALGLQKNCVFCNLHVMSVALV